MSRRLLFLDAHQVRAHRWQGGTLHPEGEFASDETGLAAFNRYLAANPGSPFFMLAEVVDEGFQVGEIPAVSGKDRTALIKRKLGQYFFGTPFATAIPLGREKSGRRDERILFAALTQPQHFEPWLDALRQNQAPLAGIYSLPLIDGAVAATVGHRAFLLVTLTRSGLRQSFHLDGRCRFSRLTPLPGGGVVDASVATGVEAGNTFQYLHSQRLLPPDGPFPVLILAHPAEFRQFRAHCRDSGELRFDCIDLVALSKRLGLKTLPENSFSDLLFLHLLARHAPASQFAPEEDRRFYRSWQARTTIVRTGIALLGIALAFAAYSAFDAAETRLESARIRSEAAQDAERHAAALRTLPSIPLSTENLRALTDRYEALVRRSPRLESVLAPLSHALDDFPKIELARIDWAVTNRPEEGPLSRTAQPGAPVQAGTVSGPAIVVDIFGELPVALVNDHRAQLAAINGLATRLRSHPGMEVKILTLPFDIESGKSLRSDSDAASAIAAPRFSLRIVARP